jgi:hypothetical protein
MVVSWLARLEVVAGLDDCGDDAAGGKSPLVRHNCVRDPGWLNCRSNQPSNRLATARDPHSQHLAARQRPGPTWVDWSPGRGLWREDDRDADKG